MPKITMNVDKKFDKVLSEHVSKNRRKTLCISVRGTQVVLSGEENCVEVALENKDEMTVGELMETMKVMEVEEEDDEMKFKTTENIEFPPFRVKFKGKQWTTLRAREALTKVLSILGFGKGGTKSFKVATDEPAGWPDSHSFLAFEYPSYANMKVANDIIESIFNHYGLDANTHPFTTEEPKTPPKKKKRVREEENIVEVTDDPNDNSLHGDPDHEEQAIVEEQVPQPGKKRKIGEYEKIRNKNIEERKEIERILGIIPHSKES